MTLTWLRPYFYSTANKLWTQRGPSMFLMPQQFWQAEFANRPKLCHENVQIFMDLTVVSLQDHATYWASKFVRRNLAHQFFKVAHGGKVIFKISIIESWLSLGIFFSVEIRITNLSGVNHLRIRNILLIWFNQYLKRINLIARNLLKGTSKYNMLFFDFMVGAIAHHIMGFASNRNNFS